MLYSHGTWLDELQRFDIHFLAAGKTSAFALFLRLMHDQAGSIALGQLLNMFGCW